MPRANTRHLQSLIAEMVAEDRTVRLLATLPVQVATLSAVKIAQYVCRDEEIS